MRSESTSPVRGSIRAGTVPPVPPARFPKNNRSAAVLFLVIGGVVAAVYANSLSGEFVCDDVPQIVENFSIKSLSNIPSYFLSGVWHLTNKSFVDYYRPLFLVILALVHKLFGESPFGYHLISLLLHIANSSLVFIILQRLLPGRRIDAFLVSLVFAVHPVHVETVSWISALSDLLMSLFLLLSFLGYVDFDESGRRRSLISSLLFFGLALLSKETSLFYPLIILAYGFLTGGKFRLRVAAFYFAEAAAFLLAMSAALKGSGTTGIISPTFDGVVRFLEFAAGYIKTIFLPWPPFFYLSVPDKGVAGVWSIVFFTVICMSSVFISRKDRIAQFGLWWFFAAVSVPLSLAFSGLPHFAMRYLYTPLIGFVIMAGRVLSSHEKYRTGIRLFLGVLVIAFAFAVAAASKNWQNDGVFYSMTIRSNPDYPNGYITLAAYYEKKGQPEKALQVCLNVIPLLQSSEDIEVGYEKIAHFYGVTGSPEQSLRYYRKLLFLNPMNSGALNGIGNSYFLNKDYARAIDYYLKAYLHDKKNAEACYNLAMSYEAIGRREDSVRYYELFLNLASEKEYGELKRSVREKIASRKPML